MLLLLAGTAEARALAAVLAAENIPAVASLSGATRAPAAMPISCRTGGFGGADGFRWYLSDTGITAILDATHPFAAKISRRTCRIADETGLPYLQLLRPAWRPEPGDNWVPVADEQSVAPHIPTGATIFLATGRQTLEKFNNLSGRRLICRQIDPHDRPFPYRNGAYLFGSPPFSVADETALFRKLKIDWLVVKNAGGQASRSKLVAARQLGIPVVMIERPKQPSGNKVDNVAQAMGWVRAKSW